MRRMVVVDIRLDMLWFEVVVKVVRGSSASKL